MLDLSWGVWVAPVFEFDVLLIASVLSSVFIFHLLLRERQLSAAALGEFRN